MDDSNWIQTYTGRVFYPAAPCTADVVIEDIAHALAHLCRFTGHCRRFYSVAEHSIWVSRLVEPRFALWGLLHDAAEAYLADVARPVKPLLAGYAEMEARILRAVAERFGLDLQWIAHLSPEWTVPLEVERVDFRMLETERRQLMGSCRLEWPTEGIEPYHLDLSSDTPPTMAEVEFLNRFWELQASLAGDHACTNHEE